MLWRDTKYVQVPILDSGLRSQLNGADMHVLCELFYRASRKWLRTQWSGKYEGVTTMPIFIDINKKSFAKETGIPLRTVQKSFVNLTRHNMLRPHATETGVYTLVVDGAEITRSREFYTENVGGIEIQKVKRTGSSMLANHKHFTVPVHVITDILPRLPMTAKNIYLMLHELLIVEETPILHTSYRDIQKRCGISDNRTFNKSVKLLADEGLIYKGKYIEMMDSETLGEFPSNGKTAWRKYKVNKKTFDMVGLFKKDPLDFLNTIDINGNPSDDGKEIRFACPQHEDDEPSASINVETSQWICHACGARGNIWTLARFGLDISEPYIVLREMAKRHGITLKYDDPKSRSQELDEQAEMTKANGGLKPGVKGVEVYLYNFPDGSPAYKKFRNQDKQFGIHRWNKYANGYVSKSKNDTNNTTDPPLLYRYPKGDEVFIVEGEKDVHTLERLGYEATTSGSATSWRDELADYFVGKAVTIIPDKDESGETYLNNIVASFDRRGIKYKIMRLEEKDVSDYMERHSADEFKVLAEAKEVSVVFL